MSHSSKTHEQIDAALIQKQGTGFRRHLGASIIGRPCSRQIWYTFRWAVRASHPARILRLFQRGHREEPALVKYLRQAGIHVLDIDPDTGEQFRVEDHDGHFGGSLDAKLFDTPDYPGLWVLGEFKTHSNKSFNAVKAKGVEESKYEHFVQMQIYMHYESLPAAIYLAVNKDNDELLAPVVEYDPTVAERYIDRALKIISAPAPPPRISESPAWYICKFCDYAEVCFEHKKKELNCRTCVHSVPVEAGNWFCAIHNCLLTELDQRQGCKKHQEIPED